MKTLITLLVFVFGTTTFMVKKAAVSKEPCGCQGTFCSCSVECDEGQKAHCTCGTFYCLCQCLSALYEQGPTFHMPVMNPDQETNSKKAEMYFRGFGTSQTDEIANGIRNLRTAILNGDSDTYYKEAQTLEEAVERLSPDQRTDFENWLSKNTR